MYDKTVPAVPARVDSQTRIFLMFVRNTLLRLCGTGQEKAVTLRDLVELGIIDEKTAERQSQKVGR